MNKSLSDPVIAALDAWVDAHFNDEVAFLQSLVRVPTDTPPGNNAPHALHTAALLQRFGFDVEQHAVPDGDVRAAGLQSIINLIVKRRYGDNGARPVIGLNAHGDVVPPGEGWTHDPYGAAIVDGRLFGRAAAVSKGDFATFTFAVRALEACAEAQGLALSGGVDLLFTYDEEFGGELGPGWLLARGLTQPDLLVAAGFSYEVVTAHNGCLQLEVTVHGKMGHAAVPHTALDALQAATHVLTALYEENAVLARSTSAVRGIRSGYINVGRIEGGTNTNVVPGKVLLKIDRRMIPEEDPVAVEARLRALIANAAGRMAGVTVDIKRLLLARAMQPLAGNAALVAALKHHASAVFGVDVPDVGTPLYTDARLFVERGIPAVIYGAGPRTVLESHAKRADERLELEDLRRATKVVARVLGEMLVLRASL
jgi:succinyl-diaminopimelate desuccinylase